MVSNKNIFWVLLFLSVYIFGSEKEFFKQWEEANKFFKQAKTKQQYEEAISYYKKIVDLGINNGHLFYNLGNAYLKAGKTDYAILYYKRAEKYIADDPYLIENLKLANSIISKKIQFTNSKEKPAFEFLFFWHFQFRYNTRLLMFIFLYFSFWLLLMIKLTKFKFPFWNFFIVIAFLLFAIGGSLGYDILYKSNNQAILIGESINIRKGDAATYEFLYGDKKIYGGIEVEILEKRNVWIKVKLPDGLHGWVKNSSVKKI